MEVGTILEHAISQRDISEMDRAGVRAPVAVKMVTAMVLLALASPSLAITLYMSSNCGSSTQFPITTYNVISLVSTGTYNPNMNCVVTLRNPSLVAMTLTFTSFSTESNWDILTLYDGGSTNGTQLRVLSGVSSGISVSSTSYLMTLQFVSDGSAQYSGFTAQVSSGSNSGGGGQSCQSGSYYDYGSVYLSGYAGLQYCTYSMTASYGYRASVLFYYFNLRSTDSVQVYDGPSTFSTRIRSGSSNSLNGVTVQGSGQYLTVVFQSGSSAASSSNSLSMSFSPISGSGGGGGGGNYYDDDDSSRAVRRGLGGAFGGYFGMTFIAMCIVLVVVYKRHQANLVRWRAMRAAQASGNGAALLTPQEVFVSPWKHYKLHDLRWKKLDKSKWITHFLIISIAGTLAWIFLLVGVGAKAWMRNGDLMCSLSECCYMGYCSSFGADKMGDAHADSAVFFAFFARVAFGFAITLLFVILAINLLSTCNPRAYSQREVGRYLAVIVQVLIGVALAFGLATYGRFKDHNSDIKLGASFYLTLAAFWLMIFVRVSMIRASTLSMIPKDKHHGHQVNVTANPTVVITVPGHAQPSTAYTAFSGPQQPQQGVPPQMQTLYTAPPPAQQPMHSQPYGTASSAGYPAYGAGSAFAPAYQPAPSAPGEAHVYQHQPAQAVYGAPAPSAPAAPADPYAAPAAPASTAYNPYANIKE